MGEKRGISPWLLGDRRRPLAAELECYQHRAASSPSCRRQYTVGRSSVELIDNQAAKSSGIALAVAFYADYAYLYVRGVGPTVPPKLINGALSAHACWRPRNIGDFID